MAKYGVDITLYCQLIEAKDKAELDTIINNYLDNLSKTKDSSVIWEDVEWKIIEEHEEEI